MSLYHSSGCVSTWNDLIWIVPRAHFFLVSILCETSAQPPRFLWVIINNFCFYTVFPSDCAGCCSCWTHTFSINSVFASVIEAGKVQHRSWWDASFGKGAQVLGHGGKTAFCSTKQPLKIGSICQVPQRENKNHLGSACLCFCPGDAHALKDLGRALVLYKRGLMPYAVYSRKRKGCSDEEEVRQYANLVGQNCAERILLYRA